MASSKSNLPPTLNRELILEEFQKRTPALKHYIRSTFKLPPSVSIDDVINEAYVRIARKENSVSSTSIHPFLVKLVAHVVKQFYQKEFHRGKLHRVDFPTDIIGSRSRDRVEDQDTLARAWDVIDQKLSKITDRTIRLVLWDHFSNGTSITALARAHQLNRDRLAMQRQRILSSIRNNLNRIPPRLKRNRRTR